MSYHHQNRGGNRRGNKSGGNRHGGGGGGKRPGGNNNVDKNNPVVQSFLEYARELDDKHDRYERIVKCSRDITIESKRIIFLLHTVDPKKNNHTSVCSEAKDRLMNLCTMNFSIIAKELQGHDAYQYLRAYTAGLQEFIEAYTYYEYVNSQTICPLSTIQELLKYKPGSNTEEELEADSDDDKDSGDKNYDDGEWITCFVPAMEFVLGLGDLSGEIMRKCVNSLGSGNVESCFHSCQFMQELYKGFISVSNARSREFSQKLLTLRQSLLKSEYVCYNLKVRGKEATKLGSPDDTGFTALIKDNMEEIDFTL